MALLTGSRCSMISALIHLPSDLQYKLSTLYSFVSEQFNLRSQSKLRVFVLTCQTKNSLFPNEQLSPKHYIRFHVTIVRSIHKFHHHSTQNRQNVFHVNQKNVQIDRDSPCHLL
jgi:hypothetical protein